MLPLPTQLENLLAQGRWPRSKEVARGQHGNPFAHAARVRALASDESFIYLMPPPFVTIAQRAKLEPFWLSPVAAPTEIDPNLALEIAAFEIGSDSAVILDYRARMNEPCVLRLKWSKGGTDNHWVEMAPNFSAFADALGLLTSE